MEITEVQRNLILLSLSNLVEEYTYALEDNQLSSEGRSFMIQAIHEATSLIDKLNQKEISNHKISRPSW